MRLPTLVCFTFFREKRKVKMGVLLYIKGVLSPYKRGFYPYIAYALPIAFAYSPPLLCMLRTLFASFPPLPSLSPPLAYAFFCFFWLFFFFSLLPQAPRGSMFRGFAYLPPLIQSVSPVYRRALEAFKGGCLRCPPGVSGRIHSVTLHILRSPPMFWRGPPFKLGA